MLQLNKGVMNMGEVLAAKRKEIEEKYADVINDLLVKYEKTTDLGFDMLIAIARTEHENRKKPEDAEKLVPEYETEIKFDMEELQKDYEEFLQISQDKANAEGLVGIE